MLIASLLFVELTVFWCAQGATPGRGLVLSTAFWAIMSIFLGLLLLVMMPRARRQLGGRDQVKLYGKALFTGVLPTQADSDRWRPMLQKRLDAREAKWLPAASPALFSTVTIGYILVASGWNASTVAITTVFCVVSGVVAASVGIRQSSTQRRHARRLLEQLPPRAPSAD